MTLPRQNPATLSPWQVDNRTAKKPNLVEMDVDCQHDFEQCSNVDLSYKTKDDAAKAALDSINPKSIAENKEYAGQIYRNPDGTYGYSDPVQGTGDESHPSSSPVPPDTDVVGNYHTHGDYSVDAGQGLQRATDVPGLTDPATQDAEADNFSQPDIKQYEQMSQRYPGFTGYLGTPSGNYRTYNPATGENSFLGGGL